MKSATALILDFNAHLSPAAQQKKYAALQENALRFYRGTCHLFYDRLHRIGLPKDNTEVWICGDLHLENFGTYKGDNRLVYFDINDFDEACLAPVSCDVLRFATAILMSGDTLGYTGAEANKLTERVLETYTATIIRSKALMIERDMARGLMRTFFDQIVQRRRDDFIAAHTTSNGRKLKPDNKRLFKLDNDRQKELHTALTDQLAQSEQLRDHKPLDSAIRSVGTGSIGCERYAVLTRHKENDKYYLLDVKEARGSSLREYIKTKQPKWKNEAERILQIQDRLQFCSPAMMGSVFFHDKWFTVRELQPVQDKMDFSLAKGKLGKLEDTVLPMAQIAAYAHLRGSGRQGASTADELTETVNRPKWQRRMLEMAAELALQMQQDYEAFKHYKP